MWSVCSSVLCASLNSLEVLIPFLHLKGISTSDFEEAVCGAVWQARGGLLARPIPSGTNNSKMSLWKVIW